jgi:hypothetical protein
MSREGRIGRQTMGQNQALEGGRDQNTILSGFCLDSSAVLIRFPSEFDQ